MFFLSKKVSPNHANPKSARWSISNDQRRVIFLKQFNMMMTIQNNNKINPTYIKNVSDCFLYENHILNRFFPSFFHPLFTFCSPILHRSFILFSLRFSILCLPVFAFAIDFVTLALSFEPLLLLLPQPPPQ